MIEPGLVLACPVEHLGDPVHTFEQALDRDRVGTVLQVDVGQLVIGDRERLGGAGIEELAPLLDPHPHQPGFAQDAVDVDRLAHRHDAVFRHDDDPRAIPIGRGDQLAAQLIDLPQIGGDARVVGVGPVFLQAIVQVRQVAQGHRRPAALSHMFGRAGDPARGIEVGAGTPELEQGKRPEEAVELVVQLGRLGIVVRDLAPVGGIHRSRRGADVRCPVHVVPPEHVGAGERRITSPARLPQLLAADQAVGLLPQRHLRDDRESTSHWPRCHARAAGCRSAASIARCR